MVFSVPRSGSRAHLQPRFHWQAVHLLSPCPESPAMCLGESDLGWVSLASASVLFPASCCLLWHRVNVTKCNVLMGWDLGWRTDGKEWKSCWDATSTHIHLLWNKKEKYRRQSIRHQVLARSRRLAIVVGPAFPQEQYPLSKSSLDQLLPRKDKKPGCCYYWVVSSG